MDGFQYKIMYMALNSNADISDTDLGRYIKEFTVRGRPQYYGEKFGKLYLRSLDGRKLRMAKILYARICKVHIKEMTKDMSDFKDLMRKANG